MGILLDLLEVTNMNAVRQARAEIAAGPDRAERQEQARLSDEQLAKQRAEEISKETENLAQSDDPIDKQILAKRKQIARLQDEISRLQSQKDS